MSGKYLYFALAALVGVLYSFLPILPFLLLTVLYFAGIFWFKKFSKKQSIAIVIVFVLFLSAAKIQLIKNQTKIDPSATDFYLQFTDNPVIDGDKFQIRAKEIRNQENLLLRYQIKSEAEKTMLQQLDVFKLSCKVSGKLEKPRAAKNENLFDYRNYLQEKKIHWVLATEEPPLNQCVENNSGLVRVLKEIRFSGIRYLDEHFPGKIAALASALIYGDRSSMEPELLDSYQKIGIIHLLAISGLHVSLFIAALYYFGLRFGATRERMTELILMILPAYAVLTGGSPSVIRAVLMIFLILISEKWKRKIRLRPVDAISLAFAFYLFLNPSVLVDPGFQLSFSVSFAIIVSAPFSLKRCRGTISTMIAVSLVAQLAALPILLYHFYEVSLLSIAANLLFIPLYSFVFLPGVYLLFVLQLVFGSVPAWLLQIFTTLLDISGDLAKFLAEIHFFRYTPGRPGLEMLLVYLFTILALFFFWEKRDLKKNRYRIWGLLLFLLTFQNLLNLLNPLGEVTVIDVGQGDSILIHLPFARGNYLIDTGGSMSFQEQDWQKRAKEFEVGKNIVVPYLKSKGITRIDKLILTHGDMDHIGGAQAIIKELNVKEIVIPSVKELSSLEVDILRAAKSRNIPVVKAADGAEWKNRDSEFRVISPLANYTGDRNRGSLTIWASIGGLHWFFGGDLDQAGEDSVVERHPKLSIDVLKVGHHGSKTSSSPVFLEHYKPKVALISAGEKNRYGHPHSQVIERLDRIQAGIYRTDRQGAITYRFNRITGTFSTFLP
ncbi:DNA internalization-related competence protein ComEC/Rec2 [Neobacillus sp. SM06]|uniref:DNA internalization-related competence protein ComEC/Rec2 n=1 Tax=Neobacillus sp. SM06 TaxID=3422492 RepID=UPI003D2DD1E1